MMDFEDDEFLWKLTVIHIIIIIIVIIVLVDIISNSIINTGINNVSTSISAEQLQGY